jgi:catechol 2,3-dioxygenase
MIERLNHLVLKAADPAAAALFATEKMGFTLEHAGEDGAHYLSAHGVDPYSLVYVRSDEPGLDHISYLVKDQAALKVAGEHLQAKAVEIEHVQDLEWNHPPAIRLRTPNGHLIELTTGVHTEFPVAHLIDPGAAATAPAPVVPDHVGLGAPDFAAEVAFATEVLGLKTSSRIMAPDGTQVMEFLRAPGRFLYHCMVAVNTPAPEMHHYQMSMKSVDSFYATYDALRERGVDIQWGPLRHGPGHNIAMYFQDGAGYWMEYSVEEEIIVDDEHYLPRTWTVADPHVVDEWQTGPPPLGLMGPPPMEPDTPEQAEIRKQVFARVGQMIGTRLYVGLSKVNMTSPPPPIEVINQHLQWALKLEEEGRLFAAGPFVDDEGKMVGDGMFIIRADSRAHAAEILAQDPIHLGNFRSCTVYGWTLHEGKLNVSVNLSDQSYSLA